MISVGIEGDLRRVMADTLAAISQAATAAVAETAEGVTADLRRQVVTAGLGQKLANTWKTKLYPSAALIYSKAPVIMGAFATGVVIRSRNGLWLAIPTDAAPKTALGRRITPGILERAWGTKLRFVPLHARASLLVADVHSGGKVTRVPMFILVPQVSLRKRLDVDATRAWAAVQMKAALIRRLQS